MAVIKFHRWQWGDGAYHFAENTSSASNGSKSETTVENRLSFSDIFKTAALTQCLPDTFQTPKFPDKARTPFSQTKSQNPKTNRHRTPEPERMTLFVV